MQEGLALHTVQEGLGTIQNDRHLKTTYFVGNSERDGGHSSTVHASKPEQLLKVNTHNELCYILHDYAIHTHIQQAG